MEQNQSSPSPRRSVPVAPINDEMVDKEVKELFNGGPGAATQPNLDDFIAKTSRTKIAIIVPMFGYFQDIQESFFDEEVLDAALERARSYAHSAYVIILAEPQRLPPWAAKILNTKFVAGNARGVAMPNGSSYGDYLRKGMQVALTETDATFFVFHNPWVVIQDHGVDTLIDRINLPDNAPVICGYEMHDKVAPEQFLQYTTSTPDERRQLSFNFFGVSRFIAEMCPLDPSMKTQAYLERDFFQNVATKHYSAVSSERVPIFSFDVPWDLYVPPGDYAHDAGFFSAKWKFLPDDIRHG